MARIRTIKPEFVESESVGKLSRDARLLFVLLWTFVDDEGRARASSRLLASRLYPYDDDAADLIDVWLAELVEGGHVRLYTVEDDTYLDIPKWLKHQKIDHASKSRLPEFRETVAKPREKFAPHTLDLGPRTMDLGPRETGADAPDNLAPEQALTLWNLTAERIGLPVAQRLTDPRRRALKARLSESGGLAGWQTALAKLEASGFLTGRCKRGDGHENWRCDLDFILRQAKFTKLMEGGFDDPPDSAKPRSSLGAALAGLA